MSDILNALTMGIGRDLGVDIRKSYFSLSKNLHKDEALLGLPEQFQQFIDDVLCLCIFNQKVILPINGAVSFKKSVADYGVKKVRMSMNTYDKEYFEKLNRINTQFYAITHKYQLDIESLIYSSKKEFIQFWTAFYLNNNE